MILLGLPVAESFTHRNSRRQVLESLVDWKVQLRVEEATAALNGIGKIEHRVNILLWLAFYQCLLFPIHCAIR